MFPSLRPLRARCGNTEMPEVKDKKFPYTKEGMKAARAYAKKTGAKTEKAPAVKRMAMKKAKT